MQPSGSFTRCQAQAVLQGVILRLGDEGPGCQQALKERKQRDLTYDGRSSMRSDFTSTINVSHKLMTADRTQGTGVASWAVVRLEGAKAEIIQPMAGATVAAAQVVGSHWRSMCIAGQQQAKGGELCHTGRGQAVVRIETTIRVYMMPSEAIDWVIRQHRKGARASARVGQNQQGRRGNNSATAQQTSVILPN